MTNRKLVIVGDSAFAEVACEYFMADSNYDVVAFSVENNYLQHTEFMNRPVVPFESLEDVYQPSEHDIFVAIVYSQLNRLRTRLATQAKQKGYKLASYISSNAFVWRNVIFGEHCFVFEDNTIQPFVKVGNNVVLWSGNHIGHHSQIADNCFISSHVVISGYCEIGENTFMGVNATVANNVRIGKDNWLGPSVTIIKDTSDDMMYRIEQPMPGRMTARRFFKVNSGDKR